MVFAKVDGSVEFCPLMEDGSQLKPDQAIARVSGLMSSILVSERTALNFLQHLSGIATRARQYVNAIAGLPCKILDTRKTLPGWRLLEKYAVRCGGGHNHRFGLYDAVLVKDNHLAALQIADCTSKIEEAIRRVRTAAPRVIVEIEVDTLEQLDAALSCRPDVILLDNMTLDQLRVAVRRRNAAAPGVLLEASGGVTLAAVRAIAETGVDRISVGDITHSAQALDIGLDYLPS